MPSLQALDVAAAAGLDASRVVHLGTFSKTVAPGMRVGWICASRALIAKLTLINQASALHVSSINQIAMLKIAAARSAAADRRRPRALSAQARRAARRAGARMRRASGAPNREGGLFSWITLPEGVDAAALLQRAVAEIGVAFVPGQAFHPDASGANTLRLSYSLPTVERIEEGDFAAGGAALNLTAPT